jgi:hypothetical protein
MSLNPNFAEAVRRLYPGVRFRRDVIIQDDSNGAGPYLAAWNLPGSPPTDAQIATAMATPVPGPTFAKLPAAPQLGQLSPITDSPVNTWGEAITAGGGTHTVLAHWNGTAWTVAAI